MSSLDEIADKLAREAVAAEELLGDPQLVVEMAKMISDSSTTLQEAFMTAVRVRRAEKRARAMLVQRLQAAKTAPD